MTKLNLGKDLYLKGRIGWQGLSKDEYLPTSNFKIINATALMDGYVDWNNCGYISEERYNEASDIQLKEEDILISKDGTLGKIGYVKNLTSPCSVASGIFVLRNTRPDLVDFDYLYHILKSNIFKNFIHRYKALGSTISHLYQRDLNNFEIELPNLDVQKKVAKVLNNLDSKIANNISIISELESLAKTIYDYWFLQFEFPNEDGKPYKSSDGKMVWNDELQKEIPEGWEVKKLSDLSKYQNGYAFYKDGYDQTGAKVVDLGNVNLTGQYIDTKDDKFISMERYNNDKLSNYRLYKNDLIMIMTDRKATMDLLGKTGRIYKDDLYVLNQRVARIRCNKDINVNYIYSALNSTYVNGLLKSRALGSIQKYVNSNDITTLPILLPSNRIMSKFANAVNSAYKHMDNCIIENQKLASLRDFLLPMLMNGQVTFKD